MNSHDLHEVLRTRFAGNSLERWLIVGGVVLAGLVAALVVRLFLTRILPKLTARTETQLDDRLVTQTATPLAALVFLGGVHVALHLPHLPSHLRTLLVDGNAVAMSLAAAIALWRGLDVLFDELMVPWAERHRPPINAQFVGITRTATKWVTVAFVAIAALHRAGFDVLSVITGLGIGGVAVALAAQETLANVLGALQIMTDQPFVVGDVVQVDGDVSGRVQRMGLRSTRLVTTSGVEIVVPNKRIAAAVLQNHSHALGLVRDVTLQLDRSLPAERLAWARELVADVLREEPRVAAEFTVFLAAFAEGTSRLRFIYYVREPATATQTGHDVLLQIRARFDAEAITLAGPPWLLPQGKA